MQTLKIGDILVEKNKITQQQLQVALQKQKENNFTKKLGEIFIEEGYINESEFAQLLATQLNIEFIDLYGIDIDLNLLNKYPLNILKSTTSIIFKEDEDFVYVSIADPLNYDAIEMLDRTIMTKPIKYHISPANDIKHIFERVEIIETTKSLIKSVKQEINSTDYKADNDQSAIMQLIAQILKGSIINKASDIHIEPNEFNVSVRNRIDGVLKEIFVIDIEVYNAFVSRVKILANLDISEKRKSQDGRFSMSVNEKEYDFRLSTAPTLHGESLVMRILDQQKILLTLNDFGLEKENLQKIKNLITSPYGIVFITGPTGSGKTTTLYAILNEIKSIENKIITIEDPIEYQLPLVQQMQVNTKINRDFSDILRSVLRQDPDIIMVGETRDQETLSTAVGASLTGHLVFSTLHTNDAPSAITRMSQMNLESYMIADSLLGIITQRLLRKICSHCKQEHKPHIDLIAKVKKYLPPDYKFYTGKGCAHCSFSGYDDRIIVCEILEINTQLSSLISKGKDKFEIYQEALKHGYRPMLFDALKKAFQSETSLEEVLRVIKP